MPILTSLDVEQKRVTQIIRISKMTAYEQRSAIIFREAYKNKTGNIRNVKNGFWEQYYEENCLNKWYSKFEQGDNSVTDELRPGRPSSISTKKNRNSQRAVGL